MKNIIIFCGGVSAEHEISIKSARNIIAVIDRNKFNPILVIISRSGTWYLQDNLAILNEINECNEPFAYGEICSLIRKSDSTLLITFNSIQIKVDAAFPVLHGPMGEDGTLQGMFEIMNLPYVGSGVLSSAIGMDKDIFKKILLAANIPVVPSICLHDRLDYVKYHAASKILNSDILFIKPCIMGSSIGIQKVHSAETYNTAVIQAFKYSTKILVEKFIPCRELECSVLGNLEPKASCIGEIRTNHEFYSYEAKYIDPNGADLIIPADLIQENSKKIQDLAIRSYLAIECKGFARVDFFLSNHDEIFVNEINTIPGFTSISMYPKLWEASGISYVALIDNLINLAFESHKKKLQICLIPDIYK